MTIHTDTEANNLSEARTALATALETGTGYRCHPNLVTGVVTPCYVVQPDGWQWFAASGTALYRVTVTCLYSDQSGDTAAAVEEMARAAHVECANLGWRIPDVPAPGTVTNPSDPGRPLAGVQFTATLPVSLRSN